MRIRMVRTPPAPLMDGFDLRGLRVDHTYDVDDRLGGYLIIADYAVPVDAEEPDCEKARTR
jgi:hypothetical protein